MRAPTAQAMATCTGASCGSGARWKYTVRYWQNATGTTRKAVPTNQRSFRNDVVCAVLKHSWNTARHHSVNNFCSCKIYKYAGWRLAAGASRTPIHSTGALPWTEACPSFAKLRNMLAVLSPGTQGQSDARYCGRCSGF